ncbi:taste receptor type 2 member 16 [Balaenoptera musculus]|uniref:Taste receptor type 2 n=1 Tax=Balaenoptera musculus TaxID=9771 RepID=A0A8B8Y8M6_BALMU|nr:taste receptor type 2 member 16 [Balaenoptera musculus]
MITIQLSVFFMIIYMLKFLTITAQSSLTAVVLGTEWVSFQRLSPVEMILTSLGVCCFCQLWSSMLYNFCSHFHPSYEFWYFRIVWEFTNILSFWLTSLLAVFYCVKVSSFSHPTFWLKWRIVRLVPRLLLGSLLISCVSIIFAAVGHYSKIQLISKRHFPRNSTTTERLEIFLWDFSMCQQVVVLIIPFLLFLASTVLLMALLFQHLRQMKDHHTSHSNSSPEAHSTALRSLAIFLIFFTSYFLTLLISIWGVLFNKGSWFWAWEAIIYALVSIHLTSLMLSSPKLKRVLKVRYWGLEAA